VRRRGLRRLFDARLRGVGAGVGDVGADGVVEQERLLGDQGDLLAQGRQALTEPDCTS